MSAVANNVVQLKDEPPWETKLDSVIARLDKARTEFASLKDELTKIDPMAPFGELKGPVPIHPSRQRGRRTKLTTTGISNEARAATAKKKVQPTIRTPEGRLSLAHYCLLSLERDVETVRTLLERVKAT